MSTTLTNGLKLPDKGSVDWYADMQNNYTILDGAVGTVAEHTTALAGKAPAVHTHSKSDITDLFNSANTWSGDNKYSKTVTVERNTDTGSFIVAKHTAAELGSLPSSDQSLTIAFQDKNDNTLCYARVYYETTGGNSFRIFVRNKYTSGAPSTSGTADYAYFGLKINADKSKEAVFRASLRPYDSTNAYNLGDATYQWNNLYAKRVNTQSVNGVNPGALSLPTTASSNIDTTNWNLRGGYICNITHTVNCYICVQIQRSVDFGIWAIGVGRQTFRAVQDGSGNYLVMVWFPCIVGVGVMLYSVPLIDTPAEDREPDLNIQVAKYFPCQGNV